MMSALLEPAQKLVVTRDVCLRQYRLKRAKLVKAAMECWKKAWKLRVEIDTLPEGTPYSEVESRERRLAEALTDRGDVDKKLRALYRNAVLMGLINERITFA